MFDYFNPVVRPLARGGNGKLLSFEQFVMKVQIVQIYRMDEERYWSTLTQKEFRQTKLFLDLECILQLQVIA